MKQGKAGLSKGFLIPKILIILCLILGAGLFVEGSIEKVKFNQKTKGYESVDGYYIDSELYSEAKRTGRRYKEATYSMIYTYTVDGQNYTVKTDYGSGVLPEYGSVKTIRYNPSNPSQAVVSGTNGPVIMIFIGLMFVLIPSVFIFFSLMIKGVFDHWRINVMDVVAGGVLAIVGGGFIYIIADGFSLRRLWALAGPVSLIPLMLLIVGLMVVFRGIFGQKNDKAIKKGGNFYENG